jgi:transketolase C-terminal domain/subunit
LNVGLINKPTLNVVDKETLKRYGESPFVVVVESISQKTGLGSRLGTTLLQHGYKPKFRALGAVKDGCGGLFEQINYQGLSPENILKEIKEVASGK